MRSATSPASTDAEALPPWEDGLPPNRPTLQPDVRMTRRLRMHVAWDGENPEGYYTAEVSEAIEWLYENGITEFVVTHNDVTYRLNVTREPD